jgi:hypothetical protein
MAKTPSNKGVGVEGCSSFLIFCGRAQDHETLRGEKVFRLTMSDSWSEKEVNHETVNS